MDILNILAVSVALAMDAFAVAIAVGVSLKSISARQQFRLTWHFGLFQALMPVIGWSTGKTIDKIIESYDQWVAFGLLTLVGIHMIVEGPGQSIFDKNSKDPTRGIKLVVLSVATSIDALVVGFSMSMLKVNIIIPAIIIGIIAALFTLLGLHAGSKLGKRPKLSSRAHIIGGIILIIIGVNILYKHGVFNLLTN